MIDPQPEPPGLDGVLSSFGLTRDALLGEGGESMVFALDASRVLRVPRQGSREYLQDRMRLLDELDTSSLSLRVPKALEIGDLDGTLWCIDERAPGRSLSEVLVGLAGADRRRAIDAYVAAAGQLRALPFSRPWFGELLGSEAIRRSTWPEFLVARVHRTLQVSRDDLEDDLGATALDVVLSGFESGVAAVPDADSPSLVHGDWCTDNILALDDGTLTAAIDFGPLSLAGDWRMDVAGAVAFMEVVDGTTQEDLAAAAVAATTHFGADVTGLVPLYRTYYALYFSFTKRDSPRLYQWCLSCLR